MVFATDRQQRDRHTWETVGALDTAEALVAILDREGRVLRCSPACARLLAFSAERVGQSVDTLFPCAWEAMQARNAVAALRDGQSEFHFEAGRESDGRRWPVVWTALAVRDSEGALESVVLVGQRGGPRGKSGASRALSFRRAVIDELYWGAMRGMDADALSAEVVVLIAHAFAVEQCGFGERLAEDGILLRAGFGYAPGMVGHPLPEATEMQWAVETGQPLLIRNYREGGRFPAPELADGRAAVSGVVVPLPVATHMAGALWVHCARRRQFAAADVRFLEIVGGMLSSLAERHRAEEARRASEERFRDIVEQTNDWVWEADESGVYTYASPRVRDLLGYAPEEVVGRTPFDLMPPAEAERLAGVFARIADRREEFRLLENTLRHRDGHLVVVETNGVPIFDSHGRFRGYRGIDRDISERKNAQRVMEANERLLRQFVENSPAAVAMFDRQMRYLLVSKRWCVDYRLGDQEIIGRSHYEVFPEVPERWKELHRRALAGEVLRCEEDPMPRADGSMDWVRWELQPWRDIHGQIGGLIMFTEVITERKRVAKERERLDRYVRLLMETTDQGIYGIDRERRCTFVNRAAAAMVGYSPEELLGKNMHQLIHHTRPDGTAYPDGECPILGAFREGKGIRVDDEVLWRKDGTSFPAEYSSHPIFEDGQITGAVVTFSDITERRRASEEVSEANARVLRGEAEKKQFYREMIRAVTHDRLHLVDAAEIPTEGELVFETGLNGSQDYADLRARLKEAAREAGMPAGAADDLVLAVGEAATNAIKHATDARCVIRCTPERMVVRVTDRGKGIRPEDVPGAVLCPGFSTKISLGMGYTIMMELMDRIWLATGPEGTAVQLEKNIHPAEHPEAAFAAWQQL